MNNKKLRLTSLARDTYVSTEEYGGIKLTETNFYGGINLLIETIEKNFELDIQNYVLVDFYSFMEIVDTLGGITVEVRQNEIQELNKFISETYKFNSKNNKETIAYIQKPGEQKLNGYKALAYCRIREGSSGGTLERDRRQRETNINPPKVLNLASQVLNIGDFNINQMEFPIDDGIHGRSSRINNKSVIEFEPSSLYILHDFIFKNVIHENNK